MNRHIQFGSIRIDYRLEFSERKTLGITVTPDLDVLVRAPFDTTEEKIEEKLRKRVSWIIKQKSFFLTFHPKNPPRRFVSGETHLFLGKQYQLMIVEGKQESVRIKGRFIKVVSKDFSNTESLLNTWYLNHAKSKFYKIAEPLIERFKKYNVEPNSIVLREMATRWGSCTPRGKIILNPELIKAPKACIEYVIIHELCHLIHHDHTQRFIDLQTKEMPKWEKWKTKLETLLA